MRRLSITATPDCSTDSDRATEPTSRNLTDPITSEAVPCTYQLAGLPIETRIIGAVGGSVAEYTSVFVDEARPVEERQRLIRWLTANSPGLNILSAVASPLRRTASAMDLFSSQV